MIPNEPQEYEHKNSVVVPLAFFDKLMRCYYGTGPRDGEQPYQVVPENPTTQIIPEISELKNTTIGPYVSIGENSLVEDSEIRNSLIQTNVHISNASLDNAMIGNHATYNGNFTSVSIGDYTELT